MVFLDFFSIPTGGTHWAIEAEEKSHHIIAWVGKLFLSLISSRDSGSLMDDSVDSTIKPVVW